MGLVGRRTKTATVVAVGAASSLYVAFDMYNAVGRNPIAFYAYVLHLITKYVVTAWQASWML